MKSIYSSALICSILAGFSSLAQVPETTMPTAAGPVPIVFSAAGLPLGTLTNGVVPPTITWLPDEPAEAIVGALGIQDTATPGVAIEVLATNGQSVLTFIYESSPATIAATTRLARGASPGGNSPQPLDSVGACVRPGSGLIGWWAAENSANDIAGSNNATTPNGMSYATGEVGQAFSFNGGQSVTRTLCVRPYDHGFYDRSVGQALSATQFPTLRRRSGVWQAVGPAVGPRRSRQRRDVSDDHQWDLRRHYPCLNPRGPVPTHLAATYDAATSSSIPMVCSPDFSLLGRLGGFVLRLELRRSDLRLWVFRTVPPPAARLTKSVFITALCWPAKSTPSTWPAPPASARPPNPRPRSTPDRRFLARRR